jgi:hypothetical protein
MSAQYPEKDEELQREKAARLPDDDVVGILLQQHARIRALFGEVAGAEGDRKRDALLALAGGSRPRNGG